MADKIPSADSTADGWKPYRASKENPWNLLRVVHRRTGFAATWNEIQRDLKDGAEASIDRALKGEARHDPIHDKNFAEFARLIGLSAARSNQPHRLKGWWMYCMLHSPNPLAEKLALMWHNHFATSNSKIEDLSLMQRQNQLFRQLGSRPFGELLTAVVKDPAMLLWLDAPQNHKGHPNENLARELMELFTLGIGHYSESDVKEAARALTGWTVIDDQFENRSAQHDNGSKTVIDQAGRLNGEDLIKILLEHPATSQRLAWRLCEEFLGEGVAQQSDLDSLSRGLRENNLSIEWAVATIVRSELFFLERNIRQRVAGPADFIVGTVRALELTELAPQTIALADWMRQLGQDLFYPPNVGGWNGGRDWLRTGALIHRANFAVALSQGHLCKNRAVPNWKALAAKHGRDGQPKDFVEFLGEVLFGGEPSEGWIDRVVAESRTSAKDANQQLQQAVAAALASPEAQLN